MLDSDKELQDDIRKIEEYFGADIGYFEIGRRLSSMGSRIAELEQLLNRYHNVLKYAHNAILHEMDNGRTPTLMREEHGGEGIGLIEDLLNEVK